MLPPEAELESIGVVDGVSAARVAGRLFEAIGDDFCGARGDESSLGSPGVESSAHGFYQPARIYGSQGSAEAIMLIRLRMRS